MNLRLEDILRTVDTECFNLAHEAKDRNGTKPSAPDMKFIDHLSNYLLFGRNSASWSWVLMQETKMEKDNETGMESLLST
jgi:hypothetical protein